MNEHLIQNTVVQSFLLREKRQVLVREPKGTQAVIVANRLPAALLADLGQLGFTLDGELLELVRRMSADELKQFHTTLVQVAQSAVGAHVVYRPLFRRFPHDVPDVGELFGRRFIGMLERLFGPFGDKYTVLECGHVVNHALFDLHAFGACPICHRQVGSLEAPALPMPALDEITPLKVLRLAREDNVWQTFANVVAARTSLSDSAKGFVAAMVQAAPQAAARHLPAEMAFKENAAYTVAALVKQGVNGQDLARFIKTPTDVLRVAVALCDGDVSLKETTKFKLNNACRRFLMGAFEALPQRAELVEEEMLKYRGRWLRLGEVLHVGAFARRYPKTAACFAVMRNSAEGVSTHAARVEKLLTHSDLTQISVQQELLATLSQRPGELARKLDVLMQRGLEAKDVLWALQSVIRDVSTTILLTLLAHFRHRAAPAEFRAFMPKGSVARMHIEHGDARVPLGLSARLGVLELAEAELRRRFAERESLGKVFVDESLAGALVPFSQRSASTGLSPLTRGSRIPFDTTKDFLRLFMNWKENSQTGRIDVDLSCAFYDSNWSMVSQVSWTSYHSMGRTVHSGDVRSGDGPHGAAEFIDIDLPALRKRGVRYAAVTVYSWTGQAFSSYDCYAGFMEREEPHNGEHFEARTVRHRFAVTGDHTAAAPLLVDLETNEVVWADLSLKGKGGGHSVECTSERTAELMRAVLQMQHLRISLKELFDLHVAARGQVAESREEADLVLDDGMLFRLDEVVAHWL